MPSNEEALLRALRGLANPDGVVEQSFPRLSEVSGLSAGPYNRAVARLLEQGTIEDLGKVRRSTPRRFRVRSVEAAQGLAAFTSQDWRRWLDRLVRAHYHRPLQMLEGEATFRLEQLSRQLPPEALALALEHVVIGPSAFITVVGPAAGLLTERVINRAIMDLGGFGRPWEAMYYRRYARTGLEAEFFDHWLGMLTDALDAEEGVLMALDVDQFLPRLALIKRAEGELGRAVAEIRRRLREDGPQEEYSWTALPYPETMVTPETRELLREVRYGRLDR